MRPGLLLRGFSALFGILGRELGTGKALALSLGMMIDQIFKNPWRGMDRPRTRKEKTSRKVLAPLVHLYRRLLKTEEKEPAFTLMEAIILKNTLLFMDDQIPPIRQQELRAMSRQRREAYLVDIAGRFFNAEMDNIEVTDNAFRYDIDHCHFAHLLTRLNHPELAPVFCRGDFEYFTDYQPAVRLHRTRTLAIDNRCCDFSFTLKNTGAH